MNEDGIFNVCMETQRILVNSEAELDAFGQASLSNWVCLCTLAELTHELLIYNRDICFNPEKWNSHEEVEHVIVSFHPDSFIKIAACEHRTSTDYCYELCPVAKHYPPCANWDFGDPHWTSPDAFKVLLRWVPHVSHGEKEGDKDGYFTLNGVRDRQTNDSGFLNVEETLPHGAHDGTMQHWANVIRHELAQPRVPSAPPSNDDDAFYADTLFDEA